ncbi:MULTISPECIES: glycosyltransferase family 1 protein [Clostridia]|uniref:glycosyltransferase family 1 protein n=1 Tax=Clostridia TaxID=186801 RepID=UPI00067F0FC2|nr:MULTISPECIES: glycosyltransferase family 1 protein [Clostridia]
MHKHILVINTIGLNYEGITFVIYNYLNSMDRSDMDIDFIAFESIKKKLKDTFEELGNVFNVPDRKKNTKAYIKSLHSILKNGYDVVHIHGNSGTMLIESALAKKCGVKRVLCHCHNTSCEHPYLNRLFKPAMNACVSLRLACSEASGKWLYGNQTYTVLNNAIDLKKFQFCGKMRTEVRAEFGYISRFVIGHIGYFSLVKNQTFLIDIFHEVHNLLPEARLLLIGEGPMRSEMEQKVKALEMDDVVTFTGQRSDVQRLYQAMDCFVMPSLWEGLPLVILEAQASGLPVLASDVITDDVKCTERIQFMSLTVKARKWAEQIVQIRKRNFDRNKDITNDFRGHGFDITVEANRLRQIYME